MSNKNTNWQFPFCPAVGKSFDFDALTKAYTWVQELEACEQDPIFHAEGNVLIHTRMVLEALVGLQEWKELSATDQSVLFLAALMHDIAKPICTVVEDGRIRAPRHAKKGAQMTRPLLYRGIPDAVPFDVREEVVQLVRHHGLPLWFWDKPDSEKTLLRVSLQVDLRKVALLSEADVLGRTCIDQQELLERVGLFRDFAREQNCYGHPYPFKNGLARFNYFQKEKESPLYVPFDETICEVTILSGLPGAGKDTWIRANKGNRPVVSLDDLRREHKVSPKGNQGKIVNMAKEMARQHLRKKQDFIWNATTLTAQLRRTLIDLFTDYKARVRIVYLETDYKTLMARNRKREHKLPVKVLERFINKIEIPQLHEAHAVSYPILQSAPKNNSKG